MKGLGQGLVGAAAQPVSGALDFMSSAFEGIDASSNTILGRLSNRPRAMKRRRLPRAIGGDRKLLPFVRTDRTDQLVRLLRCSVNLVNHGNRVSSANVPSKQAALMALGCLNACPCHHCWRLPL